MNKAFPYLLIVGFFISPITYAKEQITSVNDNQISADKLLPYSNEHFYLGGRAGWAAYADACGAEAIDCDDAFGYGLYGGYQFNAWFALEAGLNDYGEPNARYVAENVEAKVLGTEMTMKFSLPLTEQLALYTRLGAAYQDIDKTTLNAALSSNGWNLITAAGLNYRLSQNWSVRAEYQLIDGIGDSDVQQTDLHFTSIGVTYHFGQSPVIPVKTQITAKPKSTPPTVENKSIPQVQQVSLSAESLFGFDSAKIINTAQLTTLAKLLNQQSATNPIRIMGYTDSIGTTTYNQRLSELRALAVADQLISLGVNSNRLSVNGFGELNPIADNQTPEGRAKNRRVEVLFETSIPAKQ